MTYDEPLFVKRTPPGTPIPPTPSPENCPAANHSWQNWGLGDTQCKYCTARPNW